MADRPTICTRCDTANPAGAEFCGNCGKSLGGLMAGVRSTEDGERWQFGAPALIATVFVVLLVLVWFVLVRGGGDGDTNDAERLPPPNSAPVSASTLAPGPTLTTLEDVPGTTSPVPLPVVTAAPTAGSTGTLAPVVTVEPVETATPATDAPAPPTSPPATTPVTAAAGAVAGAVPGDLAVPDRPMLAPNCEGGFITVVGSAVGAEANASGMLDLLDQYPGSNYLRTDQTCPSLRASSDGEPIYVVYLGPFPFASDACAAREQGPEGSYARILSTTDGPDHTVDCGGAGGNDDDAQTDGLLNARTDGETTYVLPIAPPAEPGWESTHAGYPATDVFAQGCGARIVSPVEGTVLEVRRTDSYHPGTDNPATRGGRSVAILGDDDVRYYFAHFDVITSGLSVGDRVDAGDRLGTVGSTGRSSACHLHVGISPPCVGKEWRVRRGVVWPHPYLDAWAAGEQRSPASEVAAWSADNPKACTEAMADDHAADA